MLQGVHCTSAMAVWPIRKLTKAINQPSMNILLVGESVKLYLKSTFKFKTWYKDYVTFIYMHKNFTWHKKIKRTAMQKKRTDRFTATNCYS